MLPVVWVEKFKNIVIGEKLIYISLKFPEILRVQSLILFDICRNMIKTFSLTFIMISWNYNIPGT